MNFYELKVFKQPEYKEGDFYMETAAFMCCMTCGEIISSMGGPGQYICIPCGDFIKTGLAKGCIKREEK